MRLVSLVVFAFALACGGGSDTPSAEIASPGDAAATLGAAAADAVGACKELDEYAAAVESYAATFEQMNVADQASVMAVQQKGMELSARAQQLTTQAWFASPACATRWADVQKRMDAVAARMTTKSEELSNQAEAMSTCMMACGQGDPAQMQTCMQGCQGK
jgi:hypothetical protein